MKHESHHWHSGSAARLNSKLKDGTPVAILAAGDSGFHLTADDEEELFAALQDIRSGNYEDG